MGEVIQSFSVVYFDGGCPVRSREVAMYWRQHGADALTWHHAAVHRWRYPSVPRAGVAASAAAMSRCRWEVSPALGVCGDALGGAGVEGGWASGRALATALIDRYRASPADSGPPASRTR